MGKTTIEARWYRKIQRGGELMKLCKSCKQMQKTGRVIFDKHCVCEHIEDEGVI